MNLRTQAVASALVFLAATAAAAQSGTGPSDNSKPGPINTLDTPTMSGSDIHLYWTEPFDDTSNNDGTGIGTGVGGITVRELYYRTNGTLVSAGDFSGATLIPVPGPILAGGTAQNLWFTPPATGVSYTFALKIVDNNNNTSYGLPVSIVIQAPAGGQPSAPGDSESNERCGASSTTQPGVLARLGRRVVEGYPLLVLVGALAGVGAVLRRR